MARVSGGLFQLKHRVPQVPRLVDLGNRRLRPARIGPRFIMIGPESRHVGSDMTVRRVDALQGYDSTHIANDLF